MILLCTLSFFVHSRFCCSEDRDDSEDEGRSSNSFVGLTSCSPLISVQSPPPVCDRNLILGRGSMLLHSDSAATGAVNAKEAIP
nr:hypothetical protein Iba_chr05aCG16230 [Ipomoea batatas]GMC96299.1 hypothetical protein Iba_chr05cCG16750 [Ipomoea batatas]GMD00614.1 hypothetical protein Iba_chr05eCG16890 [Ipomoea batatas]GMD02211.1 hypothetical protein Iba_chr05fCG14450 [Ipomoea batatas]